MDARVLRPSLFFLLSLLICLDSSFAEKPPIDFQKVIWTNQVINHQDDQIYSSPSTFSTQLDDIPIIQPTTPSGNSPTMNPPTPTMNQPTPTMNPPTPFQSSLPPPAATQPNNPAPSGPTGQSGPSGPSSTGSWCVASPTASETALQVALDYACGYGGADCSAIQPGASCYNPNTVRDHASFAFNSYYQKNPAPTSCSFGGVAQLTYTDPSSGGCHYSASTTTSTTPPTPPAPTMSSPTMPTPTISSPINPYPTTPSAPSGFSDQPGYASEPTGEPSSADSITSNLLLPLTVTSLLLFLNREK